MKRRRRSPMDQGHCRDIGTSVVDHVLYACVAGLWLVCVSGCPSKASQDANQPSATSPPPTTSNQQPTTVVQYRYKVVRTYPHDPQAFTQGLVYEDGVLHEGTGLYGQSVLTKRDLESGKLLKRERLPRQYFGEGITVFRDKIIQLTWQSQTGFVYDKTTSRLLKEFKYPGEGWGLTHDGKQLIMSDGTATLRFLDPNTFAETRRLTVRDNGREVTQLNELEFIPDEAHVAQAPWRGRPALASRGHLGLALSSHNVPIASEEQGQDALATTRTPPARGMHGRIFANIWSSDSIAVIDPNTGQVTGWLDLTFLWPVADRPSPEFVLNGIAFLPKSGHLLITGKCWPKLYEIELTEYPRASWQ